MRRHRSLALAVLAAALLRVPALASAPPTSAASVQPWLSARLAAASPTDLHRVFVHAATADLAHDAVTRAGLEPIERFGRVGVVVADGTTTAVRRVARHPAVSYVEGDVPVEPLLDRAHVATRNGEAQRSTKVRQGRRLSGHGISVAVIDSGVDGTHPFFWGVEGESRVVANLKSACHNILVQLVPDPPVLGQDGCWVQAPSNDTDTGSAGGHGTHVAGIVAGTPTRVRSTVTGTSRTLSGVAPEASIVALSVGAGISVYGSFSGFNWVLEHHAAPCGARVERWACPPIRVVTNSYGPAGGGRFDEHGVVAKIQRQLVAEGVVVVWSAGNNAGDGSGTDALGQYAGTNPNGNDPTPGILMVASYNDGGTGTRDGQLSGFSSRGVKGSPETYPDVSAPGDTITSSCREHLQSCVGTNPHDGPGPTDVGTFETMSGTSMAAPYVAGVAAELLHLNPALTPAQVERAIENGAYRFTAGGSYERDPSNPQTPTSFDKGHGLVDVMCSVAVVKAGGRPVGRSCAPASDSGAPASCSTAFVDPSGDARVVSADSPGQRDRGAVDLIAGRWVWDGANLTAVLVVRDLSASASPPASGAHYRWHVTPDGGDPFQMVMAHGTFRSGYLYRSTDATSTADATADATMTEVDKPGTGADEVRLTFTDADLRQLPGRSPRLGRGLRLQTTAVESNLAVGFTWVAADAPDDVRCAYRVGAAGS